MFLGVKLYQSYNCVKRLQKHLSRELLSCYGSMVPQTNWEGLSRVGTQNIDSSMIVKSMHWANKL